MSAAEEPKALDSRKRHRTSFRSLPYRGRRRAVSAARMKAVGRRKGILQGFVESVFLVPALATAASAIVLMRFAFRLRKHFDFSVYRHTKARN